MLYAPSGGRWDKDGLHQSCEQVAEGEGGYAGKHPAGADGYKVYYPDGYVSWSPKETFEKAYHEVDMDFVNGK